MQEELFLNVPQRELQHFQNLPKQRSSLESGTPAGERGQALSEGGMDQGGLICQLCRVTTGSRTVWGGRDLKDHPVPPPAMGREPCTDFSPELLSHCWDHVCLSSSGVC